MSEIDVQAVDDVEAEGDDAEGSTGDRDDAVDVSVVDGTGDAAPPVEAPEYVLYGGKGGVGKTTMAAATGLASARAGTETLVLSTDPAHSLSDTFETDVPPEPTRIRESVPLYAAEIDPDVAVERGMDALGGEDMGMGGLGSMLGGGDGDGPLNSLLGGSMPGSDEAAAMQLLMEYLDDDRFERVVVDTAPTGHTLRLLELPDVMDSMVGRLMAMRERVGGMMDGLFGGDDETAEEGAQDLRELSERIERLRATLRDPTRTDFRVVMVPEEMSVFESERLLGQLEEFDIPVGTVVVNRVMEDLADVTDAVDADRFLSANLDDCAFCQRRWDVQQRALAEAQDVFRGHDVRRVPLFADEVRGEEMLDVVAACLR